MTRLIPTASASSTTAAVDFVTPAGLRIVVVPATGHPVAEIRLVVPLVRFSDADAAHAEILGRLLWDDGPLGSAETTGGRLALLGTTMGVGIDARQLALSAAVPAAQLPALVEMMATRLATPGTSDSAVDRARGRTAALSMVALIDAAFLARVAFSGSIGSHPGGRLSAPPASLGVVDRQSVEAFHQRRLLPRGSRLVIVAPGDPEALATTAAAAFAGWSGPGRVASFPAVPDHQPCTAAVVGPIGERALLRLSLPAPRRDEPTYPAARLAALGFAGSSDSPWVRSLRDRHGWTYDAGLSSESIADRRWDVLQVNTTDQFLLDLLKETGRLMREAKHHPLTPAQVERTRRHCRGSLTMTLGDPRHLATATSDLIGVGLSPSWPAQFMTDLDETSPAAVQAAAEGLLAPERHTAVMVVGSEDRVSRANAGAAEMLGRGLPSHTLGPSINPTPSSRRQRVAR